MEKKMKQIILILAVVTAATQDLWALTAAKDLQVTCNAKAKVTEVYNIKFNKGQPPQGRFSGIEPSLSFQASLELINQEPGCSVLKDKYQIYIGNLAMNGGISPATEDQAALISQLKNQVVDLKLKQYIGYQTKNGYLPLFPLVHSEKLNFNISAGIISGSISLPFDLNWLYQVPKTENLSDIEKLSLAEKASGFVFQKDSSYSGVHSDYLNLFLTLEPQQENLKKSYALLIWKTFKMYKESSPYSKPVLQFHVGGDGSFYGAPLATKLNAISHIPGSFSSGEIVQLLTDFPTWILAGYSNTKCLNFSTEDLEQFLLTVQLKLPVLTSPEKYSLKDPMAHIAGPIHYVSACTEGKVSAKSKMIASEILQALH